MTVPPSGEPTPAGAASTVIAIDGPAGSGKSTVARRLAAALGLGYLDTGAMYRAVTHAVLRDGLDPDGSEVDIVALARRVQIQIADSADLAPGRDVSVKVDGADVSREIRMPAVTQAVSAVSAVVGVRDELVERQRSWVRDRAGAVLEGRDIGTVVFPDATLKVYLTATVEVRAKRRAAQLGSDDWASIAADIERRDLADSTRIAAPLAEAADAVHLDTSALNTDDVVAALIDACERRLHDSAGEGSL